MKRALVWSEVAAVWVIFLAGLALRLHLAATTYLNPDEALHTLLSRGDWGNPIATISGLWANSLEVTHPPLLIYITHLALMLGRSALVPRLVPVLAGSLFPVLIWFWLRRVSGKTAAMTALLLLTFAPHLVSIGAQVRGYTLAFFFLAASLAALEEALSRQSNWLSSWKWMALYSALLWLCILSDYSMAFFVGAAGVYVLLRIGQSGRAVRMVWATGQAAAVALYALLFSAQVNAYRGSNTETEATTTWLKGAFPHAGTMWTFPFVNTAKPFAYLMASVPAGLLALAMFGAALVILWRGDARSGQAWSGRARPLAVLLALPFLLNMAGAYSRLFPYGGSRHTLVLGVFAACGVGIFVGALPRRAGIAILGATAILTPLWYATANEDSQNIAVARGQETQMEACLAYMHQRIPARTLIFTTLSTKFELSPYERLVNAPRYADKDRCMEHQLGPWRAAACDYSYSARAEFAAGLRKFRTQYGLTRDEPVWVVEGGWNPTSRPPDPSLPFTQAVRVFEDRGELDHGLRP